MVAVDFRTAVLTSDLTAVSELLEIHREELESRHTVAGLTPLMMASRSAAFELVKYLLEAGANPNAKNSTGETPLMFGAAGAKPDIVAALVEAGADVNSRNDDGSTALHYALAFGTGRSLKHTIRLLLAAGADVSVADNAGVTPAQAARMRRWSWRVPGFQWRLSGSYRVIWRDAVIAMLDHPRQ